MSRETQEKEVRSQNKGTDRELISWGKRREQSRTGKADTGQVWGKYRAGLMRLNAGQVCR